VAAPGAFPETPAFETPADEHPGFSVDPIPATAGSGNPVSLKPGEAVPDSSTLTNNTISSGVHDDPELKAADKANEEPTFSVNPIPATTGAGVHDDPELKAADKAAEEPTFSVDPIPATAGAGNPIKLAPGEPVPDASTITGNTVQSTIKTDEASYNASDAVAPTAPAPAAAEKKDTEINPQETGLFGVPPAIGTMIPESSLPIGSGATEDVGPGAGILTSSVGAGATTAALAGQVPLEPRGVPEVVKESQQEAHVAPEASANPEAVEEKKELEQELKSKVPEEPPAAESGLPTGKIAGVVGGAIAGTGAIAVVASERAKNIESDVSAAAKGMTAGNAAALDEGVPEVVKESINEAHVSPEAAANPEAVKEKRAFETQLGSKIAPSEEAGEPAPTITAATMEKAPQPTSKPTTGLNAPATAPAITEATKEGVEPTAADVAAESTNGIPATTTGVATESTPAKSEAGPATPSKKIESTPATPASTATATKTETPDSKTGDKKKKRRSVFIQKLKKIFD
jgi:hypothetical protein